MFSSLKKKLGKILAKDEDKDNDISKSYIEVKEKEHKEEIIQELEKEGQKEEIIESVKEEMKVQKEEFEKYDESKAVHIGQKSIIIRKTPEEIKEKTVKGKSRIGNFLKKKSKKKEKPIKKEEKTKTEKKKGVLGKITEQTIRESDIKDILRDLQIALLENDVSVEVVDKINHDLTKFLGGKVIKRGTLKESVTTALKLSVKSILDQEKIDLVKKIEGSREPFTILFLGFNGVGKTTTLAKTAYMMRDYNPVIAAADTFRAASIEQLEEHGKALNAKVVKHNYGSDSAAVIFDAKKHAAATGSKLVLADTAGRSHANINLMDELRKIVRVNKPDLKVLILDALTGNDIFDQAKMFDEAVGVDAVIISKTDVYEKGGAALSAAYVLKKPILFLGTGQGYEDIIEFDADTIMEKLFE